MIDVKKQKSGRSVIYLEMENKDKEALRIEAKSKGLQLIPFCRMILLEHLAGNKETSIDKLSKELGLS
jgi:hypothetical protein